MSGGSYDYICYQVGDLSGRMYDKEMDLLVKDLADLLHDLEWWQSGDVSEERYRKTLEKFKTKWFGNRNERLADIINESCNSLRADLLQMIGGGK